ncbi:MAG: short-chain dehydrogenase [Betaproteobacteria bacterium RBG_16_64_18]|nr:MAG: short-chain dehydrogenase [Betaproteobacteria bacterium RBG_16_64_18]OGA08284.1 MAG: short-chain dehydrogenase [Betaproteobacteria bacterium RIFCSPLOWO2_02_FULL_65_20]OGA36427.1 MAG: short-chain dehydrogenase [Betaproteobacteria bacterium RIFCSPLOWO2_12_FULL_65_110]
MADQGSAVIVGGTSGIGRQLAKVLADRGGEVVITGRDQARAQAAATEIGGRTRGLAVDLARPEEIGAKLASVGKVRHLVIAAIERDDNSVRKFDVARAQRLVTLKLVGYPEVIHTLTPRFVPDASIVLFGGLAKERPYPGSTTVTSVNGGVNNMIKTLAVELAPVRVNAVHPGIVGDSPAWNGKPPEVLQRVVDRTPLGRLVTMDEVVGSVLFLLDNGGINGVNLYVDGGWLLL